MLRINIVGIPHLCHKAIDSFRRFVSSVSGDYYVTLIISNEYAIRQNQTVDPNFKPFLSEKYETHSTFKVYSILHMPEYVDYLKRMYDAHEVLVIDDNHFRQNDFVKASAHIHSLMSQYTKKHKHTWNDISFVCSGLYVLYKYQKYYETIRTNSDDVFLFNRFDCEFIVSDEYMSIKQDEYATSRAHIHGFTCSFICKKQTLEYLNIPCLLQFEVDDYIIHKHYNSNDFEHMISSLLSKYNLRIVPSMISEKIYRS